MTDPDDCVYRETEPVPIASGLDEIRPEPPFTSTTPAETLEALEELTADGLRPCGCADGCPACEGTRLIATNDRGRAILAGADPDDCPTCGGSGGGPDAPLRCTACRGTGRRPENGPWSI